MNNNYCVHCSIDSKDNKTNRLSYDILSDKLTIDGLQELCSMFNAFEKYFPEVRFWVTNGSEIIYKSSKDSEDIVQRENSEIN